MRQPVDRRKVIQLYHVKGYGKRRIARELKMGRHKIDEILSQYEEALKSDDQEESLREFDYGKPHYDTSSRGPRVITDEMISLINKCLEENRRKVAVGLKKQCMLKQDIYRLLVDEGHKLAYSTLCQFIRKEEDRREKEKTQEAFIHQEYVPGEECEFDWGEVKLYINGILTRFYIAVFTLCHSNGRYAYLFRHQDLLAFMESHRNFFAEVKGVPQIMVYDNMRTAVKSFVGGKTPTDTLVRMEYFYHFDHRFCNTRAGWEKGHVERSVEYVRRRAFSLYDTFSSIEEAQHHLCAICLKLNQEEASLSTADKVDRLAADVAALIPIKGDMGCFLMQEYSVDKWSTITLKNSHYSVPDSLVGKKVMAKLYSEKVVIFHEGKKVARHERAYKSGTWRIDIHHYLTTLSHKPGALRSSTALAQAAEDLQKIFKRHFTDKPKDFIDLMLYAQDKGFSDDNIISIYKSLRKSEIKDVTADHIKTMLHAGNEVNMSVGKSTGTGEHQDEADIEQMSEDTINELTLVMERKVCRNTFDGSCVECKCPDNTTLPITVNQGGLRYGCR